GKLTDRFHFLLLLNAILEGPLRRRLQRVNNRGLAVAILLLDRQHKEIRPALRTAGQGGLNGSNIALPLGGLADGGFQRRAIASDNHRKYRAVVAFEQPLERARE